jgi:hypothetical protein
LPFGKTQKTSVHLDNSKFGPCTHGPLDRPWARTPFPPRQCRYARRILRHSLPTRWSFVLEENDVILLSLLVNEKPTCPSVPCFMSNTAFSLAIFKRNWVTTRLARVSCLRFNFRQFLFLSMFPCLRNSNRDSRCYVPSLLAFQYTV